MKIAQLGQPVLRQVARPIPPEEIATPPFQTFLAQMRQTLVEEGGVGLAGPQVFLDRRVFLACVDFPQEEGPLPFEVFVNPSIVWASDDLHIHWEGCLSFPELQVLVPRHGRIRVEYFDGQGLSQTRELEGFAARVFQHEYDHLEGILTIDRARSTRDIIKASELPDYLDHLQRSQAPRLEEPGA
jgi:peptide deformylase